MRTAPGADAQCRQHRAACAWRPNSACFRRHSRDDVADAYRDYRRLQHEIRLTGAPHARVEPAAHAAHAPRSSRRFGTHVFGGALAEPARPTAAAAGPAPGEIG